MSAGLSRLTACHTRANSRSPSAITGHITLRMSLSAMGNVERVRIRGLDGEGPGYDYMRSCVTNTVQRWIFPAPGGPLTLTQPVNLAIGGR